MMKYICQRTCILLFAVIVLAGCKLICAQKVYFFMPSGYKASTIEDTLRKLVPKLKVVVFEDVGDFKRAVHDDLPEVLITKSLVLNQITGYEPGLKAVRNGKANEPYFLVSVDKISSTVDLNGRSVGVLDFLGKKEILSLVSDALQSKPELVRVKRLADLLPLISMNTVECLFISEYSLAYLKSKSKLQFFVSPSSYSGDVGIAAIRKDLPKQIATIQLVPKEALAMLGVDSWE